ncbi:hypothetical protein BpHYR1_020692 [Brachionus plicatilis]|uniref:Uncharacterized protein n=1 Tax=Brachionus plicatilis TaxID=10195 RepID=A0A3M7T5P5_BRAPC|nr:hypothetical protein BpHYR1_020692 [Brachionus plicatilis]
MFLKTALAKALAGKKIEKLYSKNDMKRAKNAHVPYSQCRRLKKEVCFAQLEAFTCTKRKKKEKKKNKQANKQI